MTPRQVNLLTALFLVVLLAAVTLTAPRWSRFLRQPLAAAREEEGAAPEAGTPSAARAAEPEGERRISVRLYFESADQGGLVPEERSVPLAGDLARPIQTVIQELVRGSTTGLAATLPPEAQGLEAFLSARGHAYVEFSPPIPQAP